MKDLKTRLRGAYEQAAKHTQKASLQRKTYYDKKVRAGTLSVGDRVLVRILAYEGKHKIADRWDDKAYVVDSQPNPDRQTDKYFIDSKEKSLQTYLS